MERIENWLFLRGLSRDARHWGDFPDKFAEQLEVNVSHLDLPGSGHNVDVTCPLTVDEIVDILRPQFKELDKNPDAFFALSLGGMVALNWMERFPKDFKAAVIVNSSAANLSPVYKRMKMNASKAIASLAKVKDLKQKERAILNLTTSFHGNNEETLEKFVEWGQKFPVSSVSTIRQLTAATRFRVKQMIDQPMLFLGSRKDQLCDGSCSVDLAEFYQAKFELHDEAGHDLTLDSPDWVVQKVQHWLDSLK